MQVIQIFLFRFPDPLPTEPVLRIFGIAVEPELGMFLRASCQRLLHKRSRHQRRLVKHHAPERHTLNERRRPLVLSAKEIKGIFSVVGDHTKDVCRQFFFHRKAQLPEHMDQRSCDISLNGTYRFSADGKIPVIERKHCPRNKGHAHTKCFAASDSAVTDDPVIL